LGGGQEARTQTSGGEHGLADFCGHLLQFGVPEGPFATGHLFFAASCVIYRYLGKQQQWHTL
ncbi:MAG: hypothetical protein LAP21_24645, partial [Acidobacteriia bacterium]|nr:hypothetical protein [Terriglobia bacterium]